MGGWDPVPCSKERITQELSFTSPGHWEIKLLSPFFWFLSLKITKEQSHQSRQCQPHPSTCWEPNTSPGDVRAVSKEMLGEHGQHPVLQQDGLDRLAYSHQLCECISTNTGCGRRPAGKGACKTEKQESESDLRRKKELACRVLH